MQRNNDLLVYRTTDVCTLPFFDCIIKPFDNKNLPIRLFNDSNAGSTFAALHYCVLAVKQNASF